VIAMRKVFGILTLFVLVLTVSPAHADGVVEYTVSGTYATGDAFLSTPISNPGDSFLITFSVDPALLPAGPASGTSVSTGVTFDYTDSLGGTTIFSLTDQPGTATFYLAGPSGGLFDLDFSAGGDDLVLSLFGPDAGFIDGPIITLNTGIFPITPGDDFGVGSLIGDFNTLGFDAVSSGTVTAVSSTAVPEPSSLLLLGSGFLALGSFARKRLLGRSA
jgi:hypothetical protein